MAYTEMNITASTETKHVNNVKLLDYLDQARKPWYRTSFENGVESVVVHLEADFKKEVFDGDYLSIITELERIGTTSYTLKQRMEGKNGELFISSKTVLAAIDKVTRLKAQVPPVYRNIIEYEGSLLTAETRFRCVTEKD